MPPSAACNPHIQALPVVATYGSLQHFWSSRVRSSAFYSFVQVQNTEAQPGLTYHQGNYTGGNLIWNPFGSLTVGGEFLYGWRDNKDGSTAMHPGFSSARSITSCETNTRGRDIRTPKNAKLAKTSRQGHSHFVIGSNKELYLCGKSMIF